MNEAASGAAASQADPPYTNPARIHLSDVQRLLSLFTQGLAGRYLHLKVITARPGDALPAAITTDGTAIYLPAAVSTFVFARHNLGVYRIAVLHQIGYFERGTFGFELQRARQYMPDLPERAALPPGVAPNRRMGLRADLEGFFALWQAPTLMRTVFMTLEDLRIDTAMRHSYPGARADLQRVLDHALRERPALHTLPPFAALLEGLVQYSLDADRNELITDDRTGVLMSMLDAAARVTAADATVYDTAHAAAFCYRALERFGLPRVGDAIEAPVGDGPGEAGAAGEEGAEDGSADGSEGGAADDDDQTAPLDETMLSGLPVDFRGELAPEFLRKPMLNGRAGVTPENAQAADERIEHTDANDVQPGALTRPPPARRAPRADFTDGARTFLYDEWDYHRQAYLKGWCRLFEYRLQGDDHTFIRDVHRRHAVLAHQIKRRFRFIKPESWRRVRRVSDGEELELDGVIEAVIDRRAGYATDEHVYVRREKGSREVAAMFLVDMSASTDFPVVDPDAPPAATNQRSEYGPFLYGGSDEPIDLGPALPRRKVIDVAKESLALMSEALATLGDSFAIHGFSGEGRHKVECFVAKAFEDRLDARTWSALAAMKPRRSTRMGPAIRHGLASLKRQSARMKVLIVVSDGYPQDDDYGPNRADEEYGIQDTAQALKEAEQQGVQSFCMTIDPAGNDYLRRMCAPDRYLVIDDVRDLPSELTKVYRALTVR